MFMLLKSFDDKSKRLGLLNEVLSVPHLAPDVHQWVSQEKYRLQQGIKGEKDAAFYLDGLYKDDPNFFLLHDLRLVFDDEVAQIDHLLMTRSAQFFLIESKNYNGHVRINDQGEFSVMYSSGKTMGIPSPLEQSQRHEKIMRKLLRHMGVDGRLFDIGFVHVALFSTSAVIERPSTQVFDTSHVLKADQFGAWREKQMNQMGAVQILKNLSNLRSRETVHEWGLKLQTFHQKADLLDLPNFVKAAVHDATQLRKVPPARSPLVSANDAQQATAENEKVVSKSAKNQKSDAPPKQLICAKCGVSISFAEGKFCWNQATRFGGLQYCREHQKLF